MKYLIGIDDTDNKDSRGTGYNSRQLAQAIEWEFLGNVTGITRHQLFVHPDIPYTSQNSSACLEVTSNRYDHLVDFCRTFMLYIAAEGSDVGVCIARKTKVSAEVKKWGIDAKSIVLKMDDAIRMAKRNDIYLEGLTGTKDGIIGALAAVGLRAGGNDGRFIWLNSKKNLRDIEHGVHTVEFLTSQAGISIVKPVEDEVINPTDKVYLNEWARPVLQNRKPVLLVEKALNNNSYEWKCAAKEFVKGVSN